MPVIKPTQYEVIFYDRNHDGIADREYHQAIGKADANFELLDTDFDGRYDQCIYYGYAREIKKVNISAPKMKSKKSM